MTEIKQHLCAFVSRNEALCWWVVAVFLFTFGVWNQPFIQLRDPFRRFCLGNAAEWTEPVSDDVWPALSGLSGDLDAADLVGVAAFRRSQ